MGGIENDRCGVPEAGEPVPARSPVWLSWSVKGQAEAGEATLKRGLYVFRAKAESARSVSAGIRMRRQTLQHFLSRKARGISEKALLLSSSSYWLKSNRARSHDEMEIDSVLFYLLICLLTSVSYRNCEELNAHLQLKNTYLLWIEYVALRVILTP